MSNGLPSRRRRNLLVCGFLCAWVALRIPCAIAPLRAIVAERVQLLALTAETPDRRIRIAIGLEADDEALLRSVFVRDGRIVIYFPIAQLPEAAQHTFAVRIEMTSQGVRNLLYPRPRDRRYALDTDELARALAAPPDGPLVVVDLASGDQPLPVPGNFELLRDRHIGDVHLRFWLQRGR